MIRVLIGFTAALMLSTTTFAQVETTKLNNGNLILEDIPEIPNSIVKDLNRYQNTRSAPFRAWSQDGEDIFISTRFGDVSQLHRVNQPGGVREQLTFFKEPIGSVSEQPDGSLLAFTMDAGGSENAQVFLLNADSGDSWMISDGESRNGALSWRRDGKAIAYQSTRRNGASNDIWLTDIENEKESRLILESPDGTWWGPTDWNDEGDRLLIQQYVSISDSRIYELDLASGNSTPLRGSEDAPNSNYVVGFDKDNTGYFFLSNQGGEFLKLGHQMIGSETINWISKDLDWDVEFASLNDERTQGAFVVNAGGVSEVYLFDPKSSKVKKVEGLPFGLAGGPSFSPDGDQLALTLNTAKSPSDTYVLDLKRNKLAHGAMSRWTYSEVGGLNTDSFIEPELVSYPTFDQVDGEARKIPAFVYRPNTEGPAPVIISIHGGPEGQYRPSFSSTYQLWMKQLGAAVIAPNVRGSDGYGKSYLGLDNGFKREDSVKDIGALLDWIKTQPDLDENRVIVIGGSYGGYMVLASAVHYSDRLIGAIDIVGISNFVTFLKNTKDYRRDLRRVEYGDERDPKMNAHLEKISPNNNVGKIKVPMFVVQGENDPRVPVSEAEQIVKALRERGNKVWYMNAMNEGHGYRKKENRDVYQQVVVMFMENLLSETE